MILKKFIGSFFGFLSGLFWLATFSAVVWQIWFVISTGLWEWLTISSVLGLFSINLNPTDFNSIVAYAIILKLPLILTAGLLATFTGFIANKLD